MQKPVTLLILPGLDGTEVLFRPLLAALPAWVRPVVVCYPPQGPDGYADLLKFVRAEAAKLPDPFYVLASSFGGPLAVLLANAEPTRVRGTILSATFLRAPRRHLPHLGFAATAPLIAAIRTLRRLPLWLGRRLDDPYRLAKAEIWRRVPARRLAARVRAITGVDVRDTFRRGAGPVLCVTFADDKVVPPRNGQEIARCRPDVQTVTVPGDHFAMWKLPGPWTDAIVRFLAETEGHPPQP